MNKCSDANFYTFEEANNELLTSKDNKYFPKIAKFNSNFSAQ